MAFTKTENIRARQQANFSSQIPESIRNATGTPEQIANALVAYRTQFPKANHDYTQLAIWDTPAFKSLPPEYQAQVGQEMQNFMLSDKRDDGLFGGLLPEPSLNPIQQAKNIYKQDQRNVGQVVEAAQPIVEHALRNNPATMVAGTDKQLADALGWDWLSHMTGKTEQTFDRTSNKAAGFQELFERNLADQMQAGTATPSNVNRARLEADRAHVRTNSPQDIQAGIERGEYRVVGDDVVDRYGNTVLGKGLAQRGATALSAASVVFPWLAPFAAAANTATAYRHGAPAGKAIAQGVGGYYAGQAGGQLGGQLGGALGGATGATVGSAAGSGAARGATSGYASGLRGGDLLEAAALGGLSGGAGQYLGMQFQNPILSGMARGAATGAVSGYRGGNIGQGIQQGLLSGGLRGAGGLLAQSTGAPMTRQLPAMAYQQWLMNQRRG